MKKDWRDIDFDFLTDDEIRLVIEEIEQSHKKELEAERALRREAIEEAWNTAARNPSLTELPGFEEEERAKISELFKKFNCEEDKV